MYTFRNFMQNTSTHGWKLNLVPLRCQYLSFPPLFWGCWTPNSNIPREPKASIPTHLIARYCYVSGPNTELSVRPKHNFQPYGRPSLFALAPSLGGQWVVSSHSWSCSILVTGTVYGCGKWCREVGWHTLMQWLRTHQCQARAKPKGMNELAFRG